MIGGGNGGFAAAADLASRGHSVRLYSRSPVTIDPLLVLGGVRYSGVLGEGVARLGVITNELAEAADGVDLVLVCLPAGAHEEVARALAPMLDGRAPVILNPGSSGGALVFRRTLQEAGCRAQVVIGETNTLTYIARKREAGEVYVSSLVRNVRLAALPGVAIDELRERLSDCYPTLTAVPTVLDTMLRNVNAVLHPPGIVLAAAWIEHTGGDFHYYRNAGTPAVARVMADIDAERLAIGRAWGLDLEPLPALFAEIGSTSAEAAASGSFHQMLQDSEPNRFIKAPPSLEHRYLDEDIPYGLVPMSEMGSAVDVATPIMDALITIASSLRGIDYRSTGWTLEKMGLPPDPEAARRVL